MTIFERKLYKDLLKWKENYAPDVALMLDGAYGVGKTTLALTFAKKEYKSYVYLNFTKASTELKQIFYHLESTQEFYDKLQSLSNVKLHADKSLIVFDEVTEFPPAHIAVSSLAADRRYHILEISSRGDYSVYPKSKEDVLTLYPLDFDEFVSALQYGKVSQILRNSYANSEPLNKLAHKNVMILFRKYMLVGGMPKVVSTYKQTHRLYDAEIEKQKLLVKLRDKIQEADPSGIAWKIISNIPVHLNGEASHFRIKKILPDYTISDVKEYLLDMERAHILLLSRQSKPPASGASEDAGMNKFRIYFFDSGLLSTLYFNSFEVNTPILYSISDADINNARFLYENVCAQIIRSRYNPLLHYAFWNTGTNHSCLIHFLIYKNYLPVPVMVNRSSYRSKNALMSFVWQNSFYVHSGCILYSKNMYFESEYSYLPYYMVQYV